MAKKLFKIPMYKLVRTVVATLLNKFDCFIIVEGGTGMGKSTLALHLARGVKKEFRRLFELDEKTLEYYYEKVMRKQGLTAEEFINYLLDLHKNKAYNFHMNKDMIYSQKAMMKGLSSWNRIFVPDEMINVTFNRDFFSEDQKNIIKMINMYRDHRNLIIACVPSFQTLDNQIKNLCKLRLSVVRRGIAVVQAPNKIIHGKDKWDQANNEKIEREWLLKGIKNPSYAKLTTTRGMIRFRPLPPKVEAKYQNIKNEKRTVILKNEMDIDEQEEKTNSEKAVDMLLEGKVRDSRTLEGLAIADGITLEAFKNKVKKQLAKQGKPTVISDYYWKAKTYGGNAGFR